MQDFAQIFRLVMDIISKFMVFFVCLGIHAVSYCFQLKEDPDFESKLGLIWYFSLVGTVSILAFGKIFRVNLESRLAKTLHYMTTLILYVDCVLISGMMLRNKMPDANYPSLWSFVVMAIYLSIIAVAVVPNILIQLIIIICLLCKIEHKELQLITSIKNVSVYLWGILTFGWLIVSFAPIENRIQSVWIPLGIILSRIASFDKQNDGKNYVLLISSLIFGMVFVMINVDRQKEMGSTGFAFIILSVVVLSSVWNIYLTLIHDPDAYKDTRRIKGAELADEEEETDEEEPAELEETKEEFNNSQLKIESNI